MTGVDWTFAAAVVGGGRRGSVMRDGLSEILKELSVDCSCSFPFILTWSLGKASVTADAVRVVSSRKEHLREWFSPARKDHVNFQVSDLKFRFEVTGRPTSVRTTSPSRLCRSHLH